MEKEHRHYEYPGSVTVFLELEHKEIRFIVLSYTSGHSTHNP